MFPAAESSRGNLSLENGSLALAWKNKAKMAKKGRVDLGHQNEPKR